MPVDVRVRVMRGFRLRHGISLKEIADAAGKTPQWISQIELCEAPDSRHNQYRMMLAFQNIIYERKRRLELMEAEYNTMKRKLLEEESPNG